MLQLSARRGGLRNRSVVRGVQRAVKDDETASTASAPDSGASTSRLAKAMRRFEAVGDARATAQLSHGWWNVAGRRRQRSATLSSFFMSVAGSVLAQLGDVRDAAFEEGAARALERLHEAVNEGDTAALSKFCDHPLAAALQGALKEAKDAGFSVAHECRVLAAPRLTTWRLSVGVERATAKWKPSGDGLEAGADLWAVDVRDNSGMTIVLPRAECEPIVRALAQNQVGSTFTLITQAMETHAVSLQAVVDYPRVSEALLAWLDDGSQAHHYWPGGIPGYITMPRQVVFESAAFRAGDAVSDVEWRIVDVDSLLNGGAPYWNHRFPSDP